MSGMVSLTMACIRCPIAKTIPLSRWILPLCPLIGWAWQGFIEELRKGK
jgi:hypothetical protein